MKLTKFAFTLISLTLALPALASDWGYEEKVSDDTGSSVEELKATQKSLPTAAKQKPGSGKTSAPPAQAKAAESKTEAVDAKKVEIKTSKAFSFAMPAKNTPEYAWLQLFGLVAPLAEGSNLPEGPDYASALSVDQKKRFSTFLKGRLKDTSGKEYARITEYWPQLEKALANDDHKGNYRLLFRSLLRMKAQSEGVAEAEKQILLEALCPDRIAVSGDPPMSEEAIKAYSDMACFLYEQNHPGKTIDADDNREIFSLVIRDKFSKAPARADRIAMSYFPINWAKFRILYTDASEADRKVLVLKLSKAEKSATPNVANQLLEKVLSLEPWKDVMVQANKLTRPVGERATAEALKLGSVQQSNK